MKPAEELTWEAGRVDYLDTQRVLASRRGRLVLFDFPLLWNCWKRFTEPAHKRHPAGRSTSESASADN